MLRKCLPLAACLVAASAPGFAAGGRGHDALPTPARTFLRFTLAGVDVRDGPSFVRHDARTGYYLSAKTDGDHRSYQAASLVLSPERDEEAGEPGAQVQAVVLPRLRSGLGINIGDAPAVVKRKLGALPITTSYDRRTRQLVYTYETEFRLTHGSMVRRRVNYLGMYTFHNDKLWAVAYTVDDPDYDP